jgi:hypothetical protein
MSRERKLEKKAQLINQPLTIQSSNNNNLKEIRVALYNMKVSLYCAES